MEPKGEALNNLQPQFFDHASMHDRVCDTVWPMDCDTESLSHYFFYNKFSVKQTCDNKWS